MMIEVAGQDFNEIKQHDDKQQNYNLMKQDDEQ